MTRQTSNCWPEWSTQPTSATCWCPGTSGRPRPGERVAVVGDGTLALITAHLLRLYSPAELIVCGERPAQAALAAELGATGFTVGTLDTHFDLVIEAAGTRRRGRAGAEQVVREGSGPKGKVMLDINPEDAL